MAAATQIRLSISEYLHSSYRPDCDYVDGLLEEQDWGEPDHAMLQGAILERFSRNRQALPVRACPELRIQVAATRFRVADSCVIAPSAPREQIVETPPVAVIEVLSPEDRVSRYMKRLEDCRRMGIRNIRVVDPASRQGYDFSSGSWSETGDFADPTNGIHLDLNDLFAIAEDAR